MQTIRYELDADGIATLTFDEPGSPVNTMGLQWQADFGTAVAQVLADRERIEGLLLASAKTTFFAGAELKGVLTLRPEDAKEAFPRIEAMKRGFRQLETMGRPVVALLNGSALGGGWLRRRHHDAGRKPDPQRVNSPGQLCSFWGCHQPDSRHGDPHGLHSGG